MNMINKSKIKRERGFTLIELLVVISIISLLSTIVLASLNSAREKAKDAATTQNIKSLMLAMELYKDAKGFYPGQDGVGFLGCEDSAAFCEYNNGNGTQFDLIQSELSPYIPSIEFIGNSFDMTNYIGYYIFDIESALSAPPPYYCDPSHPFTEYLFLFPVFDSSGRLVDLPFPLKSDDPTLYCIGV